MRKRIAGKLGWLGAELDADANARGDVCISNKGSRLGLYVVPTNEELMIARHTLATISQAPSSGAAIKRTA